jgi:CyaY protein
MGASPPGRLGEAGVAGAGLPGAGSGIFSGPFCPQPASAQANSAAMAAWQRARIIPGIMNESEFHGAVDAVLARIESAAEALDALDVDLESGILTITCPGDTRIIVNRQTPNREIWVAARSGGFHFRFHEGLWRDTRSGEELFASLARIVEAQAGVRIEFA